MRGNEWPFYMTHFCCVLLLLLLPGAELYLIAGSFALLNDLLLPFLSIPGRKLSNF